MENAIQENVLLDLVSLPLQEHAMPVQQIVLVAQLMVLVNVILTNVILDSS
jgi:hypothetical protein